VWRTLAETEAPVQRRQVFFFYAGLSKKEDKPFFSTPQKVKKQGEPSFFKAPESQRQGKPSFSKTQEVKDKTNPLFLSLEFLSRKTNPLFQNPRKSKTRQTFLSSSGWFFRRRPRLLFKSGDFLEGGGGCDSSLEVLKKQVQRLL
jgi:hypothetical protein